MTELRLCAAALAPGTIGNIGPGLDVLGMAVSGPGDRVIAERHDEPGIVIADSGHAELPRDPRRNTAGIAAAHVLAHAGANDVGIRLTIVKGLPLSGGQGGSAASAVAGAVAANRLIGSPPMRSRSSRVHSKQRRPSRAGTRTILLLRCSAA